MQKLIRVIFHFWTLEALLFKCCFIGSKAIFVILSGKLNFDFNYVEQSKIIEYVSRFYIGITGMKLVLYVDLRDRFELLMK